MLIVSPWNNNLLILLFDHTFIVLHYSSTINKHSNKLYKMSVVILGDQLQIHDMEQTDSLQFAEIQSL